MDLWVKHPLITVNSTKDPFRVWGFKEVTDRKPDSKSSVNAADEPSGQERVTTELKEVVVNADSGHPPESRQIVRRGSLPAESGDYARLGRGCEVRGGQRFAIQFAAGGQGQRVKQHDCGRHHVVGQSPAKLGAQGGRIGALAAGGRVQQRKNARPLSFPVLGRAIRILRR